MTRPSDPQTWRERLLNGRDPDSLLCIYVGRLANEKRVDLLLEVARTPGVALTIIGDGALREALESLFAGTGTYFTGYLMGDDLPQAFASADVFAFTGPHETFGQVVQEAMASGLPSVVIDQGGVADLVLPGETGFICPDDSLAFAAGGPDPARPTRAARADGVQSAADRRAAALGAYPGATRRSLPRGGDAERPSAAAVSSG